MRSLLLILLLCITLLAPNVCSSLASDRIKHVVVLMMENRSFDHMLGYLKNQNPDIDGCTDADPQCTNPLDVFDPNSKIIPVSDTAVYVQEDPCHSVSCTTQQLFGAQVNNPVTPNNQGFVTSYAQRFNDTIAPNLMRSFSPEHVPVISSLASEFLLFDGWHSSVPGPTFPNRMYCFSSTSNGVATNNRTQLRIGMPQKSIFSQIDDMGLEWNVFFQDLPTAMCMQDTRDKLLNFRLMNDFYRKAKRGTLPDYTFIEPAYFTYPNIHQASDEHPPNDVSEGEKLISQVYDTLRASPQWNDTAFMVLFDESGGFYDHVAPPNCPSPDGKIATDDPFDFTRLGVRVPAIIASPWVEKGKVIHAPSSDAGQYEHSSLISTVIHKILQPKDGYKQPDYLTKRDEWSATFESVFETLDEVRTDCVKSMPPVFRLGPESKPREKLSSLQKDLMAVITGVVNEKRGDESSTLPDDISTWTETDGATYSMNAVNEIFGEKLFDITVTL